MLENVLIISASAGSGHVRAAQAIERAFAERGGATTVRHIDALQYTTKLFRDLYSKAYFDVAKDAPAVVRWLYDHTDRPWRSERQRLAFDKLNARPFVKLIEEHRPQITVCTHFMPAEIISWLTEEGRISTRQAVVVTDFDAHAMWLCRHHERYFVALEETKVCLGKLGIDPDRISVTGIPIDPIFSVRKDREAMRRKHGLDPDRATVLISAGGLGAEAAELIVRSLLELRNRAQVVAICGRSAALGERLEPLREASSGGDVPLHVVGYTSEMDEWMEAADVVVGKPGGLTASEALAKGLVFVVVSPIPGQEERNSDHLLEAGAAIRANNIPALAWKVGRLLDDPARLAAMRAAALRLARPRAAFDIVEHMIEIGERTR